MDKQSWQKAGKTVCLILGVAILTACGGGGGSGDDDGDRPSVEMLQPGDTVEVFEGDELARTSDETRVQVRHEAAGNRKYVTILAGTAELARGEVYRSQ